ncbi:uncharacterized protein LOC106875892 [Octopus bimaculoides]|uniref:Uncharacterized protein n=1 Tax=Octopus bimaculoides TaxID=37653 RepID=A0A0L8GME1_OCTBM|nr:uncharacterized protein LOC106875892 [Octopus bimaculoides]|eukprot:XP_014779681.1 PREDICTED: uncharacterized protein LOC106875892 [Octopus bimaculoides]
MGKMQVEDDRCYYDDVYRCLSEVHCMSKKYGLGEKLSHEELKERQRAPLTRKYQSFALIDVLQQTRSTQKLINDVQLKKQERMLQHEAEDIISCTKIEKNLNEISSFNEYLKTILQKKQSLLTNLQRPLVENAIKLEVKYHSIFVKMLSHSANVLQNLMKNIENINWIKLTKLAAPNKLPEIVDYIETNLAQVNTNYHLMCQIKTRLNLLQNP